LSDIQIAAVYFPSWHADPRRDAYLGEGFTEWDLVRAGRPRFDGHEQPLIPLAGYRDESDPAVMAQIVAEAASAGVSAFLWDWYWYEDADFLNRPLDEAYLTLDAPPVSFALMWANHDWKDVFPGRVGEDPEMWWPGAVDATQFARMTSVVIDRYLTSDAAWRPTGAAWFSIYSLRTFIEGVGGLDAARTALQRFRDDALAAGAGTLHLNTLGHYDRYTPDELVELGLDSVGTYGWGDHMPRDQGSRIPYDRWVRENELRWADQGRMQRLPYVPTVTVGWDSTTRVHQDDPMVIGDWPHLPVVVDRSADAFVRSVARAVAREEHIEGPGVVIVNAWNEWTEGSYLEPDAHYGDSYIRALRAVAKGTTGLT
jgi:hypothetical protein